MNKIITFLVLAISALLVVSCGEQAAQTSGGGAFFGGTQGIIGEFEDFGVLEGGISTVFDTEGFPIQITLKNKGEYKIQSGDVSVKLMGPAKEEFSGISSWELKNKGQIETVSDLLPEGGEEMVDFATDAKYAKPVSGLLERDWFASVEYKYQTYLVMPSICLKEDLADTRVCNVKESKAFEVSGAPIIVTSVEEETAGQGIMALKIGIQNVAGGQVAKLGEGFSANQDKLTYTIDDAGWECRSGGRVGEAKLIDGKADLLCKTKNPLAKGILATKQLRMTFDYQYRLLAQAKMGIKQSVK